MKYNPIHRPSDEELSVICLNIGTALSIIYSRRLNMKIVFDCIPKKGGEQHGRNEHQSNKENQGLPNSKPGTGHNRFSA